MAKGKGSRKAIVVSHTHWDREWYMPFQEYRFWLVELIDNLINVFDRKPNFKCFTLDGQTSIVEDYLEVRPEKLERIRRLVSEGRIHIGPWYTQPSDFLVSSESLVRNLLIGHRVGARFGNVLKVGYLPDSTGHPSQLPQILEEFGIDSFVFSRGMGDEGQRMKVEFLWQAPNGSRVIATHLIDTYCNASLLGNPLKSKHCLPWLRLWKGPSGSITYPRSFDSTFDEIDSKILVESVEELIGRLSPKSVSGVLLFLNGCDLMPAQPSIVDAIEFVNKQIVGIELVHGGLQDYINQVRTVSEHLETYSGEMWGARFQCLIPGVLSTRIYLKQQNRQAEVLLQSYAEPLACYAALFGHGYPGKLLSLAWKLLLSNQAHDSIHGSSVDPVHTEMEARFQQICQIANAVTYDALRHISESVMKLPGHDALRIVVYNPSNWIRSDIVRLWADIPPGNYVAMDKGGKVVPIQHIEENHEKLRFPTRSLSHVTFVAQDVPPNGYKEFAIVEAENSMGVKKLRSAIRVNSDSLENEFFRVEIGPDQGGTLTVIDKRNRAVYENFNTFVDEGDHGDVWDYSPPKGGDVVITSKNERAQIEIIENGPVTATCKISLTLKVPRRAERENRSNEIQAIPITSYVSLHSCIPRIDIRTLVNNKAEDHRLRVVFPTGIVASSVKADGLFCVNERPVEAATRGMNWRHPPPRTYPQSCWLEVNDDTRGITIANKGLPEYESKKENGVCIYITLVRCVGSLGKRDLITRKDPIGPPIPVPEAQCVRTHSFDYSIIPHIGDWIEARSYQDAMSFANPLICWNIKGEGGKMPAQDSFLELEPENLVVTGIKQSEDDSSTIVRFYEIAGRPVTAQIDVKRDFCEAWLANLNEKNQQRLKIRSGKVEVPVAAYEIVTMKLIRRQQIV